MLPDRAKPRMKLDVVIPDYPEAKSFDRDDDTTAKLWWRRQVHEAIVTKAGAREIQFLRESKLDVTILLVMTERQLAHGHDLDNLAKQIQPPCKASLGCFENGPNTFGDSSEGLTGSEAHEREGSARHHVVRRYREPA